MKSLRILVYIAIAISVILWCVAIIGWIKTDPGFEPIVVVISAVFSTLISTLGWLKTNNKFAGKDTPDISDSGNLEISHVDFTRHAELDITLRNLSNDDIILHEIDVLIVKDTGLVVMSALQPSAQYIVPIDDIKVGQTKSRKISFVIEAHKADRFLIALETIRVLDIRVTLHFNQGETLSFDKTIWMDNE